MKSGPFTALATSAATNVALVGLITAATLVSVPPSGTLASLAYSLARAVNPSSESLIVLDYGANRVTIAKHTAAARAALFAEIDGGTVGDCVKLVPATSDATSSEWDAMDEADDSFLQTLGAPAVAPLAGFQTELAALLDPSKTTRNAVSLLNAVETAGASAMREPIVLIDTDAMTFHVWYPEDSSDLSGAIDTEAHFEGLHADLVGKFIGTYQMTPEAGTVTERELI